MTDRPLRFGAFVPLANKVAEAPAAEQEGTDATEEATP
jgi:hypothetical protein